MNIINLGLRLSACLYLSINLYSNLTEDYKLVFVDDFEGTSLDESKWFYRETDLYAGGYNLKENVSVSDGVLSLKFEKKDVNQDGIPDYTGAGVITRSNFGYGYYETKARLFGKGTGLHSSFWTMGLNYDNTIKSVRPLIDNKLLPYHNKIIEIDGFEQDSNLPEFFKTNAHIHTPVHERKGSMSHFIDTREWFVAGFDYSPGLIRYYLNGKLVRTLPFETKFAQQLLWLTALANNRLSGELSEVPEGAKSQYDYFKFYAKSLPGVNRVSNAGFDYNREAYDNDHPMAWIETEDETASKVTRVQAVTGNYYLKHESPNGDYTVTTKQIIENIPNSIYQFSVRTKSSGGQELACITFVGTQLNKQILIPASSEWNQITLENIPVTDHKIIIEITSVAQKNQWLHVDDVFFAEMP